MSLAERGRPILGYVLAGILLSIAVPAVAYVFAYLVRLVGDVYTSAYGKAVGSAEAVPVQVGNETATFPKPSNPALSTLAGLVLSALSIFANALASPLLLAVLIALTLVAYALATR